MLYGDEQAKQGIRVPLRRLDYDRVNIAFEILGTWNLAIQLCLGCSFDPYQNICRFWPSLDFIGILLFYYLQENNRKTMKTIEM